MDQADFDKFLLANSEAVFGAMPQDDPARTALFSYYAVLKITRFERTGNMEDLEEAIRKAEQAVKATPEGHPDLATWLSNLGNMLERRFERTGRMEDLEEAVHKASQAVKATPKGHPDLASMLGNLSKKLGSRFEQTGSMEDLEEAIRMAQQALKATPDGHPDLTAMMLSNLSNMLGSRFGQTGNMEDLEESIRKADQAVKATPDGHPHLAGMLNNLGLRLESRFEITGRIEDLEEAICKANRAVKATSKGHPDLAAMLVNLSKKLGSRFEQTGSMEDLEEAIHKAEQAVKATPKGHPGMASMLHNLGIMLARRFGRTGSMEDLEEAIRKAEQAEKATPKGCPELARILLDLGTMLDRRFERTGRMADLEEAICKVEQAVKSTPEGHPFLAGRLSNLGDMLQSRFKQTGNMEDLEEAIRMAEQAVEATPKGHSDLSRRLNKLGCVLQSRFERAGRMEDLEEAIRKMEQAIKANPKGNPDLAHRLHNLGNMLLMRFNWTGNVEDLEEAICKAKQVVKAMAEDHPDLASALSSLSNMLGSRFKQMGSMEDLEEAIRMAQQALKATPDGHPDLALWLNNLSNKLGSRFERMGCMEDLQEAIRKMEQAVKTTPEGHPNGVSLLKNLGLLLSLSSESLHKDRALESFLKSWECQNGIPYIRVESAILAIQLLRKRKDWHRASAIAKQAVALLPFVNNRSLNRKDQQHAVSKFAGLAADTCSLLLETGGNVTQALELLELSRGVILSYLIDGRSDLSELKALYRDKADTYDRLRTEVNAPTSEIKGSNAPFDVMKRRIAAVRELGGCVQDIRQLPGHERFLLGPTAEELRKSAVEGPIVVVNITDIRSDAIIISTSAIKAIRLPELTISHVEAWTRRDLSKYASREEHGKNNKRYREVLSQLWLKCVKPVLQELESFGNSVSNNLPRIWWVGVGIASFLPFHAAGDHSAGSTENTLSWAVSSYTPTVKALNYARERALITTRYNNDKLKLLIVTMPTTPGERPLPGVTKEMSEVRIVVGTTFSVQSLVQPNAKKVLDHLKHCDMVHFACHGVSDFMDPSNSCLVLQEDEEPQSMPKLDKLTFQQVSELSLKRARIAYLSACSTAENRTVKLADEVIHLASGFQVAGFGHVVGSMWPSDDGICVEVAKGFYEQLRTIPDVQESNKAVAAALHDSVMKVRSKLRKQPLSWAQYVHFGA
ncbi:MAG: hypothetical protein M1813_003517 [Trichoglossum hirsutum]|nr:MAG: hypothetical protein M1813_003517 [Trichoglossum hirsutum]